MFAVNAHPVPVLAHVAARVTVDAAVPGVVGQANAASSSATAEVHVLMF
jgi:hypothetical protein